MRLPVFIAAISLVVHLMLPVRADEPSMGFVFHYPNYSNGIEELPRTGATTLDIQTAGNFAVAEPSEGVWDFSRLDEEVAYCKKNNLKMVLIVECNPLFCPQWLKDKVKAAGEMQKDANGADVDSPSISSPIYRRYQEEFIRKIVDYVKQTDKNHTITRIQTGAEWWFPYNGRYHPADVAAFRKWLGKRYGDIGKLNHRWKSHYTSFDAVPAPKYSYEYSSVKYLQSKIICADLGAQNCSWSTAEFVTPKTRSLPNGFPKVTPGKQYTFSAWAKAKDLVGQGAFLELAWVDSATGRPIQVAHDRSISGTHGWQQLTVTSTAPTKADKAWLLLKVAGTGKAWFDDVSFVETGKSANMAPDSKMESTTSWSFQNWTEGKNVVAEHHTSGGRENSGCLSIDVKPTAYSYANFDAAMYDWSRYWYEAGAEYINRLAHIVKEEDPSRQTMTYMTFSFATPVEWDYAQENAISPEEVAIRGKDIDVHALQVAAADGDPFRVTTVMDLVRKYGKPISAVDLQDFTSGVHIGAERMDKVTQSTIQHGAEGFFYYCWHGMVPDYDFYPNMSTEDLHRIFEHALTNRKLVQDLTIRPKVAIIDPILPASDRDEIGAKNDFRSFMGWYKILEGMHQTVDVVTLNELDQGTADLSRYKWILVPDCAYLSDASFSRISAYVRSGGQVVSSGRFAQFDEIGGHRISTAKPALSLPDYGRAYTGYIERRAGGNTPPLFIWRRDTPKTQKAFDTAKASLFNFLKSARIAQDLQIFPDTPQIRAISYEGEDARAVYLVNMGDGVVRNARIRLRCPPEFSACIYADGKPVFGGVTLAKGWQEVCIPEFRVSSIVRFEKARK